VKALVLGASRGLGRGITDALAGEGHEVVAVSRTASDSRYRADAADPASTRLLETHRPNILVLVAGAQPPSAALNEQTWETFSTNWNVDVRMTFEWLRAALLLPLDRGSRVIVFSSGAALAGSPLSGGYAGAKATQRFITGYAQDEAERAGLGLSFTSVLPRLTPHTELGRHAVKAYAARYGQTEAEYVAGLGTPLTPEGAGVAVVELAGLETVASSYLLTGDGLRALD